MHNEPTAQAIDVYVTYRCNMRCKHCFIGGHLDEATNMPWADLTWLLDVASSSWGTKEITFLGGEPSLYPRFAEALVASVDLGYRTRVVTNGSSSMLRLLSKGVPASVHFAFSVDGSTGISHDAIRRSGSFEKLVASIAYAQLRGHSTSITVSVGSHNIADAFSVIEFAERSKVDYVNVHYVTNRGFATSQMMADTQSWRQLETEISSAPFTTPVRFERTFLPATETVACLASSDSMMMFFPDGRAFSCSMYFDLPDGNRYFWSRDGLKSNVMFAMRYQEDLVAYRHCPAIRHVNPAMVRWAEDTSEIIGCIFDKTSLCGHRTFDPDRLAG